MAEGKGKTDIFSPIQIQRGMLELTGVWPQRNPSRSYKIRHAMTWILDTIFCVTLFMELTFNVMTGDYKNLTELLSFMASEIPYIAKTFIFQKHSKKFMDNLDKLKQTAFTNYPLVCDKHLKNGTKYSRILMRVYQFFVANLVLIYMLKPWFTKDNSAIRFEVFDLGRYRIPFHFFQVVSIGEACWNNSSLDVLSLGLIAMATSQFEVLRDKLINIREWAGLSYEEVDAGKVNLSREITPENDAKIHERIKECVIHHLAIIDYTKGLEEIYTYYFLVQFADSVLAICNTWFQFMMADDLLKIIFLVFYTATLMTQLGIYCLYGNNLTLKSADIRDACYHSDWYYFGTPVKKSLMLIMERAKRPTVLTAGKFSVLGLASYSSLMQSSYSYFTLMNHMYGN